MNANEVAPRIAELTVLIEEKETDLAHKVNRRKELGARETANIPAKQRFCSRLKLEIKQLTDGINNLKIELWGLQELNLPHA